jgi:hypothetical protein
VLERGALVPHVVVTAIDGRRLDYGKSVWQRKNLVLVSVGSNPDAGSAAEALQAGVARLSRAYDAECVITHEPVPGLPAPGMLIADRWGEIFVVASADLASGLPGCDEIAEWLSYVQRQCPECRGETR